MLYQIKRQPGAQSTQDSALPSGLQLGTGVQIVGTQKNFSAGSLQTTDNRWTWPLMAEGSSKCCSRTVPPATLVTAPST